MSRMSPKNTPNFRHIDATDTDQLYYLYAYILI